MNNIFKVRKSIYNLRNFQSLYSTSKKTVKFRTETITYGSPQIRNLISNNKNNLSSLEKDNQNLK